jgi:radical SAM domain protein
MKAKYKEIRDDIPLHFNELKLLVEERDRVFCAQQGIVIPPLEILIHPTAMCNLKCAWCIGQNITEDKNDPINNTLMEEGVLSTLVDSIISYRKEVVIDDKKKIFSTKRVSFSGITGDPLIAQRVLIPQIAKLQENGIETGMFTNGLLINNRILDILTRMNYILISVDAGSQNTYDCLKNNGKSSTNFQRLLDNIEMLNKYKNDYNRGVEINVGFVLNEMNYNEIYPLAVLLKERGVSNLRIKTDISLKYLIDESFKTLVQEQYDLVRKNLVDESFNLVELHRITKQVDRERYFDRCIINKIYANISSDGFVYACNYHPAIKGVKYGNVKTVPFDEIWENAEKDFNLSLCPRVCDPFKTRANNMLNSYFNDTDYRNQVDSVLVDRYGYSK